MAPRGVLLDGVLNELLERFELAIDAGLEALGRDRPTIFLHRSQGKCVRTPESNDGPYYYQSSLRRRAIAEGRSGVPLKLRITVASALRPGDACPPLSDAVVDIWHADADGLYSNVGADLQTENTVGQTFMRGHQVTDATGQVEFDSVVPGWEIGRNVARATHVHVKVFHENKVVTAQLYFPNQFLDELYANVDPYRTHQQMTAPGTERLVNRLRNEEDGGFWPISPHPCLSDARRTS